MVGYNFVIISIGHSRMKQMGYFFLINIFCWLQLMYFFQNRSDIDIVSHISIYTSILHIFKRAISRKKHDIENRNMVKLCRLLLQSSDVAMVLDYRIIKPIFFLSII